MTSKYPIVTIDEICAKIVGGGTPSTKEKEFWEGEIPWISSADISDLGEITIRRHITEEALQRSASNIVPEGTLMIVTRVGVGKSAIAPVDLCFSQDIQGLILKKKLADPTFCHFALQRELFKLVKKARGATITGVTKNELKKLTIPLPPLPDQVRIATLLIRAEGLIDHRKESLRLLDELVKGAFLEMFGDPVKNEKGWEKINLGKLGNWRSGGTPSRSNKSYFVGDIPWITSGELNSIFISSSKEKISMEAVTNSNAKLIEIGSLLLGMYDTAALKSSITGSLVTCNQAIAFAKLNSAICNTIFIYYYIQLGKKYLKSQQRGVRQKNLNLSMIKALKVIIPPLSLQTQFAALVEKVESLKKQYTTSLNELDHLYGSLSVRAFRGELDLSGMEVELPVEEISPFELGEPEQPEALSLGEQLVQLQQQMAKAYEPILASMKIIQSNNTPIVNAIATVSATFRHLEPIDKPAIAAIRTLSKAFEATDLDFKKLSKQISDGLSQYTGFQQNWAGLIQQMQSRRYTFDALWQREMENQDYEKMKQMLFEWVKGENPFMEQFFDETDEQIKFRLRETPST